MRKITKDEASPADQEKVFGKKGVEFASSDIASSDSMCAKLGWAFNFLK